eukprot:SAG31_NODE_752_length_12351_cov_14.467516_9_plen_79_part_00
MLFTSKSVGLAVHAPRPRARVVPQHSVRWRVPASRLDALRTAHLPQPTPFAGRVVAVVVGCNCRLYLGMCEQIGRLCM